MNGGVTVYRFPNFGVYEHDGERKQKVSAYTKSVVVNNREVFQYDLKKGLLALDLPEGELEKLAKELGPIPKKGIEVTVRLPTIGVQYFPRVREIKRLSRERQEDRSSS